VLGQQGCLHELNIMDITIYEEIFGANNCFLQMKQNVESLVRQHYVFALKNKLAFLLKLFSFLPNPSVKA